MQEITTEKIDEFINGHDPMKGIVNVECGFQDNKVKITYRNENDQKCIHYDSFYPFLWAKRSVCQKMCDGDRKKLKSLMLQCHIGVKALNTTDENGNVISVMNDGYCFLFYATQPMSQQTFNSFFSKTGQGLKISTGKKNKEGKVEKIANDNYLTVNAVNQYLIASGKRFFKGYDDYDNILRMIFDLETEGLDPKRHRITQIGIRFNRPFYNHPEGFEKIFSVVGNTKEEKDACELKAIETFFSIIYTFQPDVITGHNSETFDWPFIIERCSQLGTSIEAVSSKYFGGESVRKENITTSLKLGGEVESFYRTIVPGIIVTDSLHAVRRAQATDSNFLKADLKYSTNYLGLKKKNRVYTPGEQIAKIWADTEHQYAFNDKDGDWYLYDINSTNGDNGNFKKGKENDKPFVLYTRNYLAEGYEITTGRYIVERYLLDDVWECDKVESALNSTDFMLTKIIPLSFSKVVTMGTAGQWKAIMMAWSYENNLAVPDAANTGSFTGGLSRLLCTGYVNNVVKLDYNSLYPSIILTWGIQDEKDISNVMLHLLEYVLTTRETHKKLKKKAGKLVDGYEKRMNDGEHLTTEEMDDYHTQMSTYKIEDNRQASVKKLGNSFFGAFGSNNGKVYPWKSPICAERTTCTGRQSLRLMISHFHDLGYQPIVGDTDGFNFKLPEAGQFRYTKEHPYIGKGLSRETKEGVEYTGFEGDVAEFNDEYMRDFHYSPVSVQKMGLGIDEVVSATINFSRKNYADYFPDKPYPDDVKMVGNTIKSKKMPEYIAKFLAKGIRLLLQGKGQDFLEAYYDYVEKIYNYQIPLKDIATKGKVKKTKEEYIKDCQTLTAAGRPKSRQAWMELALKENIKFDIGETLYYINIGKTKSQADCKKETKYMLNLPTGQEDITNKIDKEFKAVKKECKEKDVTCPYLSKEDFIAKNYPKAEKVEEIILNSKLLPREIIESEEDIYDVEGLEYNVSKYLDMFNKRITPLLVCFSKNIRDRILINNPDDRPYFTKEECSLTSGEPNKPGDQDTYEQLMTMEDKEIKFWAAHPEFKIPFLTDCHMDWDKIYQDFLDREERDRQLGIDKIKKSFNEIIAKLSDDELEEFIDDGTLPDSLTKLVEYDPNLNAFVSPNFPDISIATINDIIERSEVEIGNENDDSDNAEEIV